MIKAAAGNKSESPYLQLACVRIIEGGKRIGFSETKASEKLESSLGNYL